MSDDLIEYTDPVSAMFSDLQGEITSLVSSKGPDMTFSGDVAIGPVFGGTGGGGGGTDALPPGTSPVVRAAVEGPKLNSALLIIIVIVLVIVFNSEG